ARNILNNPKTTAKIREVFGATIFNQEQKIDRKKLAAIVFSHASELQKLNNIIHPQLRINFLTWTEKQTSKYVIQEAAILFENGFHSIMDKTICVSADKKLRLERVMQRDEATKEEVLARMAHQWSDKKKEELAEK
ncbi:MAG: dephospho-CoA kinase, partial [Bacteroidetes bacterium 4572_77]